MGLASTPSGLPGSQGNETAVPPAGEPPSAGIAPRTTAVRAPRPPFVRGLPFIGNAWEMGTDPGAFFVKCYREAGPIFRIRLFNKPYTVLAGPEANRFIAREGDTHLRSKEFWQEFVDEFGAKKSLINTDGEIHDKIRKVMKRGYGRASISGRYQELIDITDRMLQDEWQPGQRLRVVPAMQRLAAEQLGIMVAGRAPGEYVDDLRVFIRYALNVLVVHMRPRIMLRMPDYRRAKKRIFELGQRMIDSYDPSRVDPKQPTLIDDIMAAAKQDETLFEGAELMAAVLGPYFAGLDTVANTTSAMLYAVLKHRDVHEQVLAEADGVFAAGPVTPESLRNMRVLHGAVMETLRMYPIAVAAMRNATRDFEFAGHLVEKDEPLFIAITVSHFLEQFYSIPTKFDITRFAPPRNEHKQAGAFAPFSLGDHTCLGVGIAEVQIALTMATLFHRLQMELAPSDYQMRMKAVPTPGPELKFSVRVLGRRH